MTHLWLKQTDIKKLCVQWAGKAGVREHGRLEVVIDASSGKYPIFARARRGHLIPVVLVGVQVCV